MGVKQRVKQGFLAGFVTHVILNMLVQDWMGKEEYIKFVDTRWYEWNSPISLIVYAIGFMIIISYIWREY